MTTIERQITNTVPVGKTPVPKYATWDELRDAMHRDAEARRTAVERRRYQVAI
jgi:hypothetical protein